MSNPDKCESDLIKLQAENERLKEALERIASPDAASGVAVSYGPRLRDIARLALKENSND